MYNGKRKQSSSNTAVVGALRILHRHQTHIGDNRTPPDRAPPAQNVEGPAPTVLFFGVRTRTVDCTLLFQHLFQLIDRCLVFSAACQTHIQMLAKVVKTLEQTRHTCGLHNCAKRLRVRQTGGVKTGTRGDGFHGVGRRQQLTGRGKSLLTPVRCHRSQKSASGAGVAKVTAGTGVAYSVTGAGAARVAAALTPCAEPVLHIRDADNFRKAVQKYLPSPTRRPTDDATNWDIMGLSPLRHSNFRTDHRHVVAVKLRLRGRRDQLFALLEMGNVIDDRSWRGMLRVSGVGDRWCSLLYKSGVADLRLLQYVGDSVAIHVDTCHGHRGCLSRVVLWCSILYRSTVLYRNSMLPGCSKTNLQLLQDIWDWRDQLLRSCKKSRSDSPITRTASANSCKSTMPLPWASISPNAASSS